MFNSLENQIRWEPTGEDLRACCGAGYERLEPMPGATDE